jgi:hypothetical protein
MENVMEKMMRHGGGNQESECIKEKLWSYRLLYIRNRGFVD